MSDVTFKVSGQSESPTRLAVQVRGFELIVDEPPGLGGDDEGPNPVEYILAGLAGCLNVMGHIIAKEMGSTIRSLTIDAAGPLNPRKLLGKQTDDRAGYKNIDVTLKVDADVDQATLDQWLATIETRCPVSDNLMNLTPVAVRTQSAVQSEHGTESPSP